MLFSFQELLERNRADLEALPLGQKAKSLIELLRDGARVPPGYCLSAEALEHFLEHHQLSVPLAPAETAEASASFEDFEKCLLEAPLPESLRLVLERIEKESPELHWAVRSSGVQEDLADASFAGLYHSILNVKGAEALERALRECWLSLYGERVRQYAERQGIALTEMQLGVVIQAMIPAESSGVLFSLHPIEGHDTQMVVEAVPGLGEALVSGSLTPDRYTYDWYHSRLIDSDIFAQARCLQAIPTAPFTQWHDVQPPLSEPVLSESQLAELCRMAVEIQAACGFPVDLEWVFYQQQFYIVQRRPITRVFTQGIAGEWTTADFKDGGVSASVCTPLMWSLYDYIWEQTLPAYLRKTHLLAPESEGALWGDMFYGRPYWNVGAVKAGLKTLPGFDEREFDRDLGIAVPDDAEGQVTATRFDSVKQGLKVLSALKRSFSQRMDFNPLFVKQQEQVLSELADAPLQEWDDRSFFTRYAQLLLDEYYISESAYFYHIFDNSNVTTLFKDAVKAYRERIDYLALMSGLKDLSHLRPNFALWDLSRQLRQRPEALRYWTDKTVEEICAEFQQGADLPGRRALVEYLQRFGYHSTHELDLSVPRYSEDPRFVFQSLQALLILDDAQDPRQLNAKQCAHYERARTQMLKAVPFYKRRALEKQLQQMRRFLWWREELRDYSTQMYAQIRRFTLELARRLVALGWLEQESDVFFLRMRPLLALLRGELDVSEAQAQISRNRNYYQSFRNFTNPNEIGMRYEGASELSAADLSGVPCSPGSVVGTARVVQDIFDAERLQAGDILITRFTDPGWTPKFGLLSGVATETGGLLSHAAVISREYGIPAVLAVPDLMQRVQDGQRILLDGHRGQIILEPPEAE